MHTPTLQGELLQTPRLYSLIVSTNRELTENPGMENIFTFVHFWSNFPLELSLGHSLGEQVWASECISTSALRHKEKNNLKHQWKIGLLSPMWLRT